MKLLLHLHISNLMFSQAQVRENQTDLGQYKFRKHNVYLTNLYNTIREL